MSSTLFSKYGVEIEYMIVDKNTLQILPISDFLLQTPTGEVTDEVEGPADINWSNEFVAHLIELRPKNPVTSFDNLDAKFQKNIIYINSLLAEKNAMLLPTGCHPLMDSTTETKIWAHQWHEVYENYHRIFNAYQHGTANVQSVHLNLPFSGDEEFGKLHAALRILLPIIPALAASSPFLDGKTTGFLDSRLEVYRHNYKDKIDSITGLVIPEAVFSIVEYAEKILQPMYKDIAPYDGNNSMQQEFLNSRGARPVFSQGRIEIRVTDSQESSTTDIAIAHILTNVLKKIVAETWQQLELQKQIATEKLHIIFLDTITTAENTIISDLEFLKHFGISEEISGKKLWEYLIFECTNHSEKQTDWHHVLQVIIEQGTLATRILKKTGTSPSQEQIITVYSEIANCLAQDKQLLI